MPLFDAVKDLTLVIERVELEPHALPLQHLTRRTTVVHLHGAGQEGVGEDVSYEEELQLAFTADALPRPRRASTRSSRSPSSSPASPATGRWGLESAALDLALRQAGRSLAEAVGREPRPVRVRRLAERRSQELLALYPDLRFKLDASDAWTDEVVAELARDRRGRRRRPEGPLRRRLGRRDAVRRALPPRRRGASPTRGSRTRA